jgi:hypothetical protein
MGTVLPIPEKWGKENRETENIPLRKTNACINDSERKKIQATSVSKNVRSI